MASGRETEHGGDLSTPTSMDPEPNHCCACWRYTDDMRRQGDLVHEAVALLINGGTLAVENTEAFKAADAFLAARFRANTDGGADRSSLPMPKFG